MEGKIFSLILAMVVLVSTLGMSVGAMGENDAAGMTVTGESVSVTGEAATVTGEALLQSMASGASGSAAELSDKATLYSAMSDEELEQLLDQGGTYSETEMAAIRTRIGEGQGVDQEMIPPIYFEYLVDVNEETRGVPNYQPIKDHLKAETVDRLQAKSYPQGYLSNNVEQPVECNEHRHYFDYASVLGVSVEQIGILKMAANGGDASAAATPGQTVGEEKKYVFYTVNEKDSPQIVYSVIPLEADGVTPKYKIQIHYGSAADARVNYSIKKMDGSDADEEYPFGLDETFGEYRPTYVKFGNECTITAEVPRGYRAKLVMSNADKSERVETTIGDFPQYKDMPENHLVVLADGSVAALSMKGSVTKKIVTTQTIYVELFYEKVETFTFNASAVSGTQYFGSRSAPRAVFKFPDTVTSLADNKTSYNKVQFAGQELEFDLNTKRTGNARWEWYVWEMDSLDINGTKLNIPFLRDGVAIGTTATEATTLPSGTVVEITAKMGSEETVTDGSNGTLKRNNREYHFKISNCFEDITITGGNFVSHMHQEIIATELTGVEVSYWNIGVKDFLPMYLSVPIARAKRSPESALNGFMYAENTWNTDSGNSGLRIKVKDGYYIEEDTVDIRVTLKDGTDVTDKLLFDFRNATDNKSDVWYGDGFGHKRILDPNQVGINDRILFLKIRATPKKLAMTYDKGAVDKATGMPEYDNGGEGGYNLIDHSTIVLPDYTPNDASSTDQGYKRKYFVGWSPVDQNDNVMEDIILHAGAKIELSTANNVLEYAKWNDETKRFDLKLVARWSETPETDVQPITYRVWYYLNGERITSIDKLAEIPEGGTITVDYFSGKPATATNRYANYSKDIQAFLNSADVPQDKKWKLDEEHSTKQIENVHGSDNKVDIFFYSVNDYTANKDWQDANNKWGTRKQSIKVRLLGTYVKDGKRYTSDIKSLSGKMNSDEDWSYTWMGLPEYHITYERDVENNQYVVQSKYQLQYVIEELDDADQPIGGGTVIGGQKGSKHETAYQIETDPNDANHFTIHVQNKLQHKLTITKKDVNAPNGTLANAGFLLYEDEACTRLAKAYWDEACTQPMTEDTNGHRTGADGTLTIYGLTQKDYYVKEAYVPAGYAILKDPYKLTIREDGTAVVDDKLPATVDGNEPKIDITISNVPLDLDYPSAGGAGIFPIQLAGILLLSTAAIMLFRKKGRENPLGNH